jgi:hypothetical protein
MTLASAKNGGRRDPSILSTGQTRHIYRMWNCPLEKEKEKEKETKQLETY